MDVACLCLEFNACPRRSDTCSYDLGDNAGDKRVCGGFKPYSQLHERYFMERIQQRLRVFRSSSVASDLLHGCGSALLRSVSCVFSSGEVSSA